MNYKAVLKGTVFALVIAFSVVAALTVVNYFCELSKGITDIISLAGLTVGIIISSLGVSSNCEKMKLLNSMAVSVLCFAVLFLVSVSLNKTVSFNMHSVTVAVCCIAASVIGAMLG